VAKTANEPGGSRIKREGRELGKLVGAVGLVALAFVLVANLWPDGFDGPVDAKRLAGSGDALKAVRSDLSEVSTSTGTVDQGTELEVTCHMGDSVPVGPFLKRVWTAAPQTDLSGVSHRTIDDMIHAGWTRAGQPSENLARVSKNVRGLHLVADIEFHDDATQARHLTVYIYVDGPDGCMA
jgi:hypothetical protein